MEKYIAKLEIIGLPKMITYLDKRELLNWLEEKTKEIREQDLEQYDDKTTFRLMK